MIFFLRFILPVDLLNNLKQIKTAYMTEYTYLQVQN